MSLWIPLFTDFVNHPKTVKLRRALNLPTAEAYVIRLWLWCAVHFPDGKPDLELLEEAIGWRGKGKMKGKIIEVLRDSGFLVGDSLSGWNGRAGSTLQKIEAKRKADRERKATRHSAGIPTEVARNSNGSRVEVAATSHGSRTEVATQKEKEKENDILHPHTPASGGGAGGLEAPKKKRTGIRRKKRPEDYPAEVHAFVRQFREDFHDNVQADYDFGEVTVSELRAASRLLNEATRDQLGLEMRYFMGDRRDVATGEFPGWALVILSVANWLEKRDKIRASMLREGVL